MSGNNLEMLQRGRRVPFEAEFPTPALAANASGSVVTTELRVWTDRRTDLSKGACTVVSLKWTPSAAVTVNANAPTITVNRRTSSGTLVAQVATLALTTGGPFPALAEVVLPLQSANVELNVGESLYVAISQPATTGVAVPLGTLEVDVQPTHF